MPDNVSPSCTVYSPGAGGAVSGAAVASSGGGGVAAAVAPGAAVGAAVGGKDDGTGFVPDGVKIGASVAPGWTTAEPSPGNEGGRTRSQRATTLATSRAKTEARKTALDGVALTGSRHSAQRSCSVPVERSSPCAGQ